MTFLLKKMVSGLIDYAVSNIDPSQFVPSEPPPPQVHQTHAALNETAEERQFRRVFEQLAGEDMEVSPNELMGILNKIIGKHSDMKTDGFSLESCRGMVAVMDGDSTGKLGFHEFKFLWNNIKRWQRTCTKYSVFLIGWELGGSKNMDCLGFAEDWGIYKTFDADRSGTIGADELPKAFKAAGFPLNDQLFQMIVRRYSDENGNMDFDNYIGCLVRLDAMCRAFKTLDKDNNGTINVNIQEWLQLTMYS